MGIVHPSFSHAITGILVWLSATTAHAFSSDKANTTLRHTVQPGETLTDIAEMYGFSKEVLITKNRLDPSHPLMLGQQIIFPEVSIAYANDKSYSPYALHSQETSTTAKSKSSATGSLQGTPYAYYGNGEPVTDALRSFASNYGLPVVISNKVNSVVNGKVGPLTPVPFLDTLAQLNNLLWYFDGDTLYIYDGAEIDKTIISLNYLTTNTLKKILIDMGLWDNRYGWRERPNEGLIYLSGPPRYIELVTETATLIDAKTGEQQKSQLAFKVFALKYAWAEDHTIGYRNKQVTIPGVATLLRKIVLGGGGTAHPSAQPDSPTYSQSIAPATPITGKQPPKLAAQNLALQQGKPEKQSSAQADNVIINADRRSNAIIVHDLASKMSMYENLIRALDKPLSQIEINVSIIDVDTSSINELGVNWKLNSSGDNSFFNFDPSSKLATSPASTILKISAGRLLSQIRLLATKNKAKILSRPSVLTLDNMEAVLDNNQTFYVSVNGSNSGDNTAQLYPITSGSVLRVTPRIIKEKTGRKIHLDVNIQDGNSQNSTGLTGVTLPIVKNTTISTQAMIDENESLLVGGYFYEKTSNETKKVPFLGDLPLVGQLFRENTKIHTKNVRLFLITPKIINLM